MCLITSSLCHKLKNARKFQANSRYFIYSPCHGASFYSFTCLQTEDEGLEKLSCVCLVFGLVLVWFGFLVLSVHVINLALLCVFFFLNVIRVRDYTDPVLQFLISAEQALLALTTQIAAMLLCALVCLAMNSSVLTYHLSLRPEKEIILAFLLLI